MYFCSNLILSGEGDSDISSGNLPGDSAEAWSDNNLDQPAIIDWTQKQHMKAMIMTLCWQVGQNNQTDVTDSQVMLEEMLKREGRYDDQKMTSLDDNDKVEETKS